MPSCRRSSFITLRDREIGCRHAYGDTARTQHSLSSSLKAHHTWDPKTSLSDTDHGGVFNFDFSKNGSILGAACERKSVLLFDPFNGKLIASKTNAHTDCVNCVKFLDDRLFATCSDDTTVALWDTRYLKHTVQTFRGHSNWVKNIEYDSQQGILVTSGFDGCIYAWNINRYSNEEPSNKVFYTSGLMRSKLSPDFSKLIISTHEGYIIVVHNLDLSTLGEDLKGFKPNMYRLMQRSKQPFNIGLMYNRVFEQERNRVQFIADWPSGNDASVISSLQVHPQGWCILSRNTDSSEATEWTCVHELQDDSHEKKSASKPLWEMDMVTPHTSSAYCQSTNTPAYSSLAPSNQSRVRQSSTSENPQSHGGSTQPANQDSVSSATDHSDNETEDRDGQESTVESSQPMRDRPDSSDRTEQETPQNAGALVNELESLPPERHFDIPRHATGPIHNSLIQIRRGAVQEDGSYSLSISVHTSSGRTIEFNQDDLASDDDESDIRIERIIRNPLPSSLNNASDNSVSETRNQASENVDSVSNPGHSQGQEASLPGESSQNHNPLSTSEASDEESDGDSAIPLIDDNLEYDDFGNDEEHESDLDLIEELSDNNHDIGDVSNDDDSDHEHTGIEIEYSNEETGREMNFHLDNRHSRTSNNTQHGLFRNSGLPRIRRRSVQNSSTDRQPESRNSSNSTAAASNNGRSENAQNANAINSLPVSNSLTFVLESNSGHRRRQILNLSYLDRYSEAENEALLKKVHWNKKALLSYAEECNVGQGFIKEVGFSADGRLISSPFGYGIRIFAFDSLCNELCDCVPTSPVKLYEVKCSLAHGNCVVATKFSPVHNLVVSGCLDGKIAFHQPVL